MARWAGEMEFEFIEEEAGAAGGGFVATAKIVQFLRTHLARGEVDHAARLYEDAGASVSEELIAEAQTSSSNTQAALAEMFVKARDFGSAGRVFEIARKLEEAAAYYEKATDYAAAGRCYEASGDLVRAAQAYERGGEQTRALDLYKKAGPSEALAEALARQGRYADAAGMFGQLGNLRAEIEMLRLVPMEHAARVPSVLRLAELLEQYGHGDQAAGLLIDTVRTCEAARMHQPMYMMLVRVLTNLGRHDEAGKVRERIENLLGPGTAASAPAALAAHGDAPVVTGAPLAPAVVTGAPSEPAVVTGAAVPAAVLPAEAPTPPAASAPSMVPDAVFDNDPFANLVDPFDEKKSGAPTQDAYGHLKSIPIFHELALQDMKDLYRACQQVQFGAGDVLIEQGIDGPGLFVVVQGDLKVLHTGGPIPKELATLGPGSYVGELSLVDDALTSARVVAESSVSALFISRERFHQFLYGRDIAAMRIYRLFTRTLAGRLRQANVR